MIVTFVHVNLHGELILVNVRFMNGDPNYIARVVWYYHTFWKMQLLAICWFLSRSCLLNPLNLWNFVPNNPFTHTDGFFAEIAVEGLMIRTESLFSFHSFYFLVKMNSIPVDQQSHFLIAISTCREQYSTTCSRFLYLPANILTLLVRMQIFLVETALLFPSVGVTISLVEMGFVALHSLWRTSIIHLDTLVQYSKRIIALAAKWDVKILLL